MKQAVTQLTVMRKQLFRMLALAVQRPLGSLR
jgi:hypothetical protein